MDTKKKNASKIIRFFLTFIIVAVPIFSAALILRNLGWLVGQFIEVGPNNKFDFVSIFEQTQNAQLSLHWFLPLILGIVFCILDCYIFPKIKNTALRITIKIILFLLLFLVAFVFSLMLTCVNGIRFFDLLEKLLPLIDKL